MTMKSRPTLNNSKGVSNAPIGKSLVIVLQSAMENLNLFPLVRSCFGLFNIENLN